jgi:hypothetical protein
MLKFHDLIKSGNADAIAARDAFTKSSDKEQLQKEIIKLCRMKSTRHSDDSSTEKKSVCKSFLEGRCSRGNRCKYLHVSVPKNSSAEPAGTGADALSWRSSKQSPVSASQNEPPSKIEASESSKKEKKTTDPNRQKRAQKSVRLAVNEENIQSATEMVNASKIKQDSLATLQPVESPLSAAHNEASAELSQEGESKDPLRRGDSSGKCASFSLLLDLTTPLMSSGSLRILDLLSRNSGPSTLLGLGIGTDFRAEGSAIANDDDSLYKGSKLSGSLELEYLLEGVPGFAPAVGEYSMFKYSQVDEHTSASGTNRGPVVQQTKPESYFSSSATPSEPPGLYGYFPRAGSPKVDARKTNSSGSHDETPFPDIAGISLRESGGHSTNSLGDAAAPIGAVRQSSDRSPVTGPSEFRGPPGQAARESLPPPESPLRGSHGEPMYPFYPPPPPGFVMPGSPHGPFLGHSGPSPGIGMAPYPFAGGMPPHPGGITGHSNMSPHVGEQRNSSMGGMVPGGPPMPFFLPPHMHHPTMGFPPMMPHGMPPGPFLPYGMPPPQFFFPGPPPPGFMVMPPQHLGTEGPPFEGYSPENEQRVDVPAQAEEPLKAADAVSGDDTPPEIESGDKVAPTNEANEASAKESDVKDSNIVGEKKPLADVILEPPVETAHAISPSAPQPAAAIVEPKLSKTDLLKSFLKKPPVASAELGPSPSGQSLVADAELASSPAADVPETAAVNDSAGEAAKKASGPSRTYRQSQLSNIVIMSKSGDNRGSDRGGRGGRGSSRPVNLVLARGAAIAPSHQLIVAWQLPEDLFSETKEKGGSLVIGLIRMGTMLNGSAVVAKKLSDSRNTAISIVATQQWGDKRVCKGDMFFFAPKAAGMYVFRIYDESTKESRVATLATSEPFAVDIDGRDVTANLKYAVDLLKNSEAEVMGVVSLRSAVQGMRTAGVPADGSDPRALMAEAVHLIAAAVSRPHVDTTAAGADNSGEGGGDAADINSIRKKKYAIDKLNGEAYETLRTLTESMVVYSMLTEADVRLVSGLLQNYCPLLSRFFESKSAMDQERHRSFGFVLSEISEVRDAKLQQQSVEAIRLIEKSASNILPSLLPSVDFLKRREEIRQRIQTILNQCGAIEDDVRLEIFGSSRNNFGSDGADLDMCIQGIEENGIRVEYPSAETIASSNAIKAGAIEKIAMALRDIGNMHEVVARSTARIPIVLFRDPKSGLTLSCILCNETDMNAY